MTERMKRVTCRDLGKMLGISHVSVSLALRNHPSLPEITRLKVQALADQLGYRPDPMLSALSAYRQSNQKPKFQATLAWINAFADPAALRATVNSGLYFQGAKSRAEELGYELEEFWVPTARHWERLVRTLHSRRIVGLLVPPRPPFYGDHYEEPAFPWEDFCAVSLGQLAGPLLHLIINNQFESAALSVRKLYALGYRKIGLVMPLRFALHSYFYFLGGYHAECARLRIPSLCLTDYLDSESAFQKRTVRWIKEQKPEALIASGPGEILPALKQARVNYPADVALAFLSCSPKYPEIAGIDQNDRQIGVQGAEKLIDIIRRNERGRPPFPTRTLIAGTWIDAPSAPPLSINCSGGP